MPLPPAPFKRRLAALLYELLLVGAVTTIAGMSAGVVVTAVSRNLPQLAALMPGFVSLAFIAAWWLYFKLNWLREGQTLPMRVWKIGLAAADGARPTLKQYRLRFLWSCVFVVFVPLCVYAAFARGLSLPPKAALGAALCWWILPWGFALLHPRRQFLYDFLAGTELTDLRAATRRQPEK